MVFEFYKYQGTGNDFILVDNREAVFRTSDVHFVRELCDRRFGIGADGLILLEHHPELDFKMVYYNSDGNLSSMCGNGGRCLVHFAQFLGIVKDRAVFEAVDGLHQATINHKVVSLQMKEVSRLLVQEGHVFLDTGSPHHVQMVSYLDGFDVYSEGKRLRNELYGDAGANINFVEQLSEDTFKVRTYERGVENETLSCGTGVTAVAIAMHQIGKTKSHNIYLKTLGGDLEVSFQKEATVYTNVFLIGPAVQVFKGNWSCG